MVAGTASAAVREEECRGSRLYECHWKGNHFLNDMKPAKAKKRRESVRCGNFSYFLQNEILIFSLAHCFQLISITLFSLSSQKRAWCYSPWCTYSHIYSVFLQWGKKNGETFFPIFPQCFCVSSFHNI
jgi:hypothetical protein